MRGVRIRSMTGSSAVLSSRSELAGGEPVVEGVADGVRVGVGEAHRREDDAERLGAGGRLRGDLRGQLEVRQAGDREDRQLLAAHEGGEGVDGGDAGEHRVAGRSRRVGFSGLPATGADDVPGDRRPAVDRLSASVADAAQPALARPGSPLAHRRRRRSCAAGPSPSVPSNTCTTARSWSISRTIPWRSADRPRLPARPGDPDDGGLVPPDPGHPADEQQRPVDLLDVRVGDRRAGARPSGDGALVIAAP